MQLIVSVEWLHDNQNDSTLVILDASQYKNQSGMDVQNTGCKIKGARWFDLENVFSDRSTSLPHMLPPVEEFEEECRKLGIFKHSKIVMYDNLGIYFSPRVWWMFKVMGHENISVLDGGLPAWVGEGLETEACIEPTYKPGDFEASFNPVLVKDVHSIKDNFTTKSSVVIDARSEERFNGTAPEPRAGLRQGHIPGAVNRAPLFIIINSG